MGRYRNPVLPGCHPDPSVCRFGDDFVLVTSSFEYLPGLPVHVSRDLVSWQLVGHAIQRPEQLDLAGLPSSRGLFAPAVRVVGDRLMVVCTVVGPDDGSWPGRAGHFAVWATDVRGPWSDPIWIDGVVGIDPSLTVDGERLWLTGTVPAPSAEWPGQTDVWLVELDPDTLQPLGAPATIWNGAMVGAVWAEGPRILPRPGGGWMLLAAEGGTAREHAVCVAYAEEITGPYRGDPGNPRLTHRDLGPWAEFAAVGHADLVQAPDGAWWSTVLATHAVDGQEGLLGRQSCLVAVGWDGRRPVFAPGTGRVELTGEVPGADDPVAGAPSWATTGFGAGGLAPDWNGVGRHPQEFARMLDDEGAAVALQGGGEPSGRAPQAFLGRRLPEHRTRVGLRARVHGGADARGGLLLRTSEAAQLELATGGASGVQLVLVVDGRREVVARQEGSRGGAGVLLELELDGPFARASVDGHPLAEVELSGLVPDPASGFVGAWVGPFAVGAADAWVEARDFVLAEAERVRA